MTGDKHRLAQEKRTLANRIRGIIWGISLDRDRERLRQHADQLEREANELERQSPPDLEDAHPPTVEQQQAQVQQQQDSEPKKR